MITKAKKLSYTTSAGASYDTIEEAKTIELQILIDKCPDINGKEPTALGALVAQPREAIAILKMGLPRKPRTVKAKAVKAKKPAVTQPA